MDPSTKTGEQNIPTMAGSISEMPDPNSGDANVGEYDTPTTSGQNIDDKKIPKIGMIFDSVEEAKTFYNAYAKLVGFGIRTQANRKNKRSKGEFVSSMFVCSKEGFKKTVGQPQYERPATRTGCNARMGVRREEGGKYVIYKVELVHNHEVSPSTVRFYRSHKKMDTGVRKVIRQNCQAGIRTHKSIQSLAVEVGGVTNLEFEERDVRNFIAKQRRMELKDGDAQALYTYFCEMQQKYPGFYYTANVDEESRLILLAETEISLFKQEKLRLQSQLEGALKASDNAQSLLRAERASSRAAMFTDEEFKSLKLQVSELNLLRESNMQLREENKYNFEECQKLREIAQKAATETEYLNNLLREREAELDASKKETEMLNIEKRHLESRISELLERAKDIDVDVEDYERIKEDFRQIQLKLLEKETEVEETKKNINEKQDTIAKLEQELANTHSGYTEAEKRLTSILQSERIGRGRGVRGQPPRDQEQ